MLDSIHYADIIQFVVKILFCVLCNTSYTQIINISSGSIFYRQRLFFIFLGDSLIRTHRRRRRAQDLRR